MKSSDFGVEEPKLKEITAVVENRLDSLQIESEGPPDYLNYWENI